MILYLLIIICNVLIIQDHDENAGNDNSNHPTLNGFDSSKYN